MISSNQITCTKGCSAWWHRKHSTTCFWGRYSCFALSNWCSPSLAPPGTQPRPSCPGSHTSAFSCSDGWWADQCPVSESNLGQEWALHTVISIFCPISLLQAELAAKVGQVAQGPTSNTWGPPGSHSLCSSIWQYSSWRFSIHLLRVSLTATSVSCLSGYTLSLHNMSCYWKMKHSTKIYFYFLFFFIMRGISHISSKMG